MPLPFINIFQKGPHEIHFIFSRFCFIFSEISDLQASVICALKNFKNETEEGGVSSLKVNESVGEEEEEKEEEGVI